MAEDDNVSSRPPSFVKNISPNDVRLRQVEDTRHIYSHHPVDFDYNNSKKRTLTPGETLKRPRTNSESDFIEEDEEDFDEDDDFVLERENTEGMILHYFFCSISFFSSFFAFWLILGNRIQKRKQYHEKQQAQRRSREEYHDDGDPVEEDDDDDDYVEMGMIIWEQRSEKIVINFLDFWHFILIF